MTDDSKEHRFNSVIRYLRESGFTIIEEKHTIVTSEFYAKILSPQISLSPIELKSYPSLGNGIIFQITLANSTDKIPYINPGDLRKRIEHDRRMSEILTKNEALLSNTDKELAIQKIQSLDPQKAESKFEILSLISILQTVTKNLEDWIDSNVIE